MSHITLPQTQAHAASLAAAKIAIVYKLKPEIADEITRAIVQAVTGMELVIVETPARQQLLAPFRKPPAP